MKKSVYLLFILSSTCNSVLSIEQGCPGSSSPDPDVLFCDSFEVQGDSPTSINSQAYFDFNDDGGDLQRTDLEAIDGGHSMRVLWQPEEKEAGAFFINFGRSPLPSNIHNDTDFSEIYWRWYIKYPAGFQGYPDKMTRLMVFANSNWAQAMVAHVWAYESGSEFLALDPVSGIRNNELATTTWNDLANFNWLGIKKTNLNFPKNQWVCVEARVKLNTPNQNDGIFQLYIDDNLEASTTNINWLQNWSEYGINSIHFSNYWNAGSPVEQSRYLDAIVVSKARIGCINTIKPNPPTDVIVN